MSLIDEIKRDREAGTPGPWALQKAEVSETPFDWWIHCDGFGALGYRTGNKSRHNGVTSWGHRIEDARRIARVPDMEAALLAAEELAEALKEVAAMPAPPECGLTDFGEREHYKWEAMRRANAARAALTAFQKAVK